MKHLITGLVLSFVTTVSYAKTFNCTAYLDGSVVENMTVNASKAAVAETKAVSRMKKEKKKVDYVACK